MLTERQKSSDKAIIKARFGPIKSNDAQETNMFKRCF